MAVKKLIYILLMAAIIFSLIVLMGCNQGEEIEISLPPTTSPQLAGQVYIGGAVNNPGYYPLKEGDDIEDLIRAAGGLTDGTDLSLIELRIPQPGEENETQKIDINRAPAWLLEALPGIGEVKAQAIIDCRQQNGLFKNINELLKVEGIGQATLDNIRDFITIAD
ncbi:MAG: ComEA family DNA-binding protein [Chloroflexota bacterium]